MIPNGFPKWLNDFILSPAVHKELPLKFFYHYNIMWCSSLWFQFAFSQGIMRLNLIVIGQLAFSSIVSVLNHSLSVQTDLRWWGTPAQKPVSLLKWFGSDQPGLQAWRGAASLRHRPALGLSIMHDYGTAWSVKHWDIVSLHFSLSSLCLS